MEPTGRHPTHTRSRIAPRSPDPTHSRLHTVAPTARTQEPPLRFIPGETAPTNQTKARRRRHKKERGTDGRQDGQAKGQAPGVSNRDDSLIGVMWHRHRLELDEATIHTRRSRLRNQGSESTLLHLPREALMKQGSRWAKRRNSEPWQATHHVDLTGDSRSAKRDRAESRSIDEEAEDRRTQK